MSHSFETCGISIVICTRDRNELLSSCLRNLVNLIDVRDVDWELVIVDNNEVPQVHTFPAFSSFPLSIRFLHEPIAGLSRARNHALDNIDPGRHIIWTDDDVEVSPKWLSVYERAFRYWPEFDFFGGPVNAQFEQPSPQWIKAALRVCPEIFAAINPVDDFVAMDADSCFYPFGANMAFRSGVFTSRRFDTSLGRQPGPITRGGDENYLIQSLVAQGAKGLWLPPASVDHWISSDRQTLENLYDHKLGDTLIDELVDANCDIDHLISSLPAATNTSIRGNVEFETEQDSAKLDDCISDLNQRAIQHGRDLAKQLAPDHFRYASSKRDKRLLVLGLDGFVPWIADEMIGNEELPNLRRLRDSSARVELDHGDAMLTGLAWEHVSVGRSPQDYDRYAAVNFDPETYRAWQIGTREKTFVHGLTGHTVVFDVPYFDILGSPQVSGMTNWGSHDPGVSRLSKPITLSSEIQNRFGRYPAHRWIYGFTWPSPDNTAEMAESLRQSVERRGEILPWLLTQRFPEWELAITTVGEFHSACESFWHGIDPNHPLHALPSAPIAGQGLRDIYRATDRLVGIIKQSLPDTDLLLFSMHGMTANHSDVATMLLLPELLFRHSFRKQAFEPDPAWFEQDPLLPLLGPELDWSRSVNACIHIPDNMGIIGTEKESPGNLQFMPASHYQPAWHMMHAFALPSFYDGRIRLNLKGREKFGLVEPGEWRDQVEIVSSLLRDCRDTLTNENAVESIQVSSVPDPVMLGPTECDIRVQWKPNVLGWTHPEYGQIGPAPFRRPGGHGGPGCAWIHAKDVASGDYGRRSSFDVVPTILDLIDEQSEVNVSGSSIIGNQGTAR